MIIVRDYLTSVEIGYIINAMLEKESAIEREVVKVALVAQLLCDDVGEFEDCSDIYNKVVADSKLNFSAIVNNYDIIDKLYKEETGIEKIAKEFVNSIEKKLDDTIGNFDLSAAISQLKEITDKQEKENKPVKGGKNVTTKKNIS